MIEKLVQNFINLFLDNSSQEILLDQFDFDIDILDLEDQYEIERHF